MAQRDGNHVSETIPQQPIPRPRTKWDAYRRISAWSGLIEAVAVVVIIVTLGHELRGGSGGQKPATTWAIVILLGAPAIFSGLVSGSRYFALYAGYAERLNPTAKLSAEDSASGDAAASSFIGDAMWGSLIAGIAGSIPATFALSTLFGPFSVLMLPLFVLIIGIAWFAGWTIGGVTSLLLSAAIGIAVGAGRRERLGEKLTWLLVAILLPTLLAAVAIPIVGTRFADGHMDAWGAILAVAGFASEGTEFVLGEALRLFAQAAIWISALLFAALVVVGTPALLQRLAQSPRSEGSELCQGAERRDPCLRPAARSHRMREHPPQERDRDGGTRRTGRCWSRRGN